MPAVKMYVSSFKGWMFASTAKTKAAELATALNSVGASYKSDYFYAAGYNRWFDWHEFGQKKVTYCHDLHSPSE